MGHCFNMQAHIKMSNFSQALVLILRNKWLIEKNTPRNNKITEVWRDLKGSSSTISPWKQGLLGCYVTLKRIKNFCLTHNLHLRYSINHKFQQMTRYLAKKESKQRIEPPTPARKQNRASHHFSYQHGYLTIAGLYQMWSIVLFPQISVTRHWLTLLQQQLVHFRAYTEDWYDLPTPHWGLA